MNAHFSRCAAGAVAIALTTHAVDATVIYSGVYNLTIPSTINGLYLNVINGAYNTTGGGGNTVPGWTINLWGSSGLSFFVSTSPVSTQHILRSGGGGIANIAPSDHVGPTPIYGGWSNSNSSASTSGNQPFVLNSSTNGYGFRFKINGDWHYGWARIQLASGLAAQPRYIVEWMWQDVPEMPIWGYLEPLGACCFGESCSYTEQLACVHLNAQWLSNVTCWPNPCGGPTPECEGDIVPPPKGNGVVGVNDLIAVIEQWGPCPEPPSECAADVTGDAVVGVPDLLRVINRWGPCG